MSTPPLEVNGRWIVSINVKALVLVVGMVLSVTGTIGGAGYAYVVAKIQSENNQKNLAERMARIEAKFDGFTEYSAKVSDRLARIETSNQDIKQSIDRLELASVPKGR